MCVCVCECESQNGRKKKDRICKVCVSVCLWVCVFEMKSYEVKMKFKSGRKEKSCVDCNAAN